jgi:hypothetical protein
VAALKMLCDLRADKEDVREALESALGPRLSRDSSAPPEDKKSGGRRAVPVGGPAPLGLRLCAAAGGCGCGLRWCLGAGWRLGAAGGCGAAGAGRLPPAPR